MSEENIDSVIGGGSSPENPPQTEVTQESTPAAEPNDWRSSLPEDIQQNDSLSKFTSVEALAKSYLNAEKMIGRDTLPIPNSDDEFSAVYDKLGRPEASDNYEFNSPEGINPHIDVSNEENVAIVENLKTTAHEIGLNQKQMDGLNKWYHQTLNDHAKAIETHNEQTMAETQRELQQSWGEKTEANLATINRAINEIGGDDLAMAVSQSGLGNSLEFIQFMHKMVNNVTEESGFTPNQPGTGMSPDVIQSEINSLMSSPAYLDKTDVNHAMTVKKVSQLYNRLHAA